MADKIFPTQITDGTPAGTDRILFDDGVSAKDCAISELPISTATQTALNNKQDTLVSGTNIKTINGNSILGSGNLVISGTGLVDSVNGQTGEVVLDTDDISEGTTNKYLSSTDKTDLTDGGDSSLHYHSSDRNRTNHTGTQLASTISDFQTAVSNNVDVRHLMSTALITNATLQANVDTTKFDIGSFTCQFVDNYTDVNNPTVTKYTYPGSTANVITNLSTWDVTYISIDKNGVIYQTETNPIGIDTRDKITIGALIHTGHTGIENINTFINTNPTDVSASLGDISNYLGIINSGNIFSANGANLKINKSSGNSIQVGLNWKNSKKSPNVTTDTGLTAPTFIYSWRNGTGGFNTTITSDIVPGRYDDNTGGATQPNGVVLTNKWSLHKIYWSPDASLIGVEYGQSVYNTEAEAEASRSIPTSINPLFSGTSFRGWIVVRGGATTLNSIANAVFIDAGKFGSITGGTGSGSSTTTLQQAYDNSGVPQITTLANSLQVKNGSGSDSNYTQEWFNNAGTKVIGIRGDGVPTASTDLITKNHYDTVANGVTNALKSATTTINVSSATAPTTGQVLTATSSTSATWQTPSGGSAQIRKMFAIAGTIGATGTNVANTVVMDGTYTLTKCNLWYGTAGNGTLTIDINKNGTTVYSTTKPSITGTNQSSINSGTITTAGCVSGDVYTLDIDAVPGTPGTDLFVELVFTS